MLNKCAISFKKTNPAERANNYPIWRVVFKKDGLI
jgi:hypothetical protein